MNKNYIKAVSTMIGTIIGVGMFSIPYIATRSGILVIAIYFVIFGALEYWLQILYAELILSTKEKHRLPGYAEKYLGPKFKKPILFITILANFGSLLALIILGGAFLNQLLTPWLGDNQLYCTFGLLLAESIIILYGIKLIAKFETALTILMVLAILIVTGLSYSKISLDNYYAFTDWKNILLPYGPIFFAVSGMTAVNEICLLLKNDAKKIKSALKSAIFISALVMFIFAVGVIGVSGSQTSHDAISGLALFLNPNLIIALLFIGLLAIITSFLTSAQAMIEVFVWDFDMKKSTAWLAVCFMPLEFYLLGLNDLTTVISLTGAIGGGLIGAIYILIARKAKQNPELNSPIKVSLTKLISLGMLAIFTLGLVYELTAIFK